MEIIFRILQSSKLGTLLFNIFLGDLFVIIHNIDIANYANDNTPHIIDDNIDDLIKSFEEVPLSYSNGLITTFLETILASVIQ